MTVPASAVIFDMDGVLVDSSALHERAWREYLRTSGLPEPEDGVRSLFGRRAIEAVAMLHGLEPTSPRAERELDLLQRNVAELAEEEPVRPSPGARNLLVALRAQSRPVAIATSATRPTADRWLGDLASLVDTIVTADDVVQGKPHPEIYLQAADHLRVPPTACVVVEDAVVGVQAATAAGMRVFAVLGTADEAALRSAGASAVVSRLGHVRELLE